ncbi:ABC1-domain-containing protein [Xylaria intraflava]|nr:ABC1-domain-containing protein [Xylaria intraflava]
MGFADIILDLAAVAKASRSVASRHWELRGRQIDRYSRTSSIIRSFQENEKKVHETVDRSTTNITGDTIGENQQQESHIDAQPVQPGLIDNTGSKTAGLAASEDSYKDSTQDAYRNISQHDPLRGGAAIQRQAVAWPGQSARLAQLREKTNADQKEGFNEANAAVADNLQEGTQPGINLQIFHTRRGAQMLEGQKPTLEQLQPKAPPKPTWFKDFGHNERQRPLESRDQKPLPSISTAPGRGSLPGTESATAADVTNRSPLLGELFKLREGNKIETSSSAPRTEIVSEKIEQATSGRSLAGHISNRQESGTQQTGGERVQTIKDNLSREGVGSAKQPESVTASLNNERSIPAALRESTVPATRLSRLWNYGGLAAGMLGGALSEGISRGFGGGGQGSVMFNANNMERLVAKLSRMRGAALKLGQMMSFQDAKMLPGPIQEILQRVQDRADYMPAWQRDRVLAESLGPEWRDLFEEFEDTPIAAASIGQVHRATLKSGEKVAVKIQFPGVADSINSDLDNISILLRGSKVLPKGLYLNKTIDNARVELGWECDYKRELECGKRYKELLSDESDIFTVPKIYPNVSGKHVLTMEFMEGVGVTRVTSFTQAQRDWIGTQILRLCLREIVEFRFMQTDPNWTNFLYNAATNKLELLDFGASREFPALFVAQYVALLAAAARQDHDAVLDYSRRLGYLTGHESRAMLDAHVASILTLAEPFLQSAPEVYDFADQTITERVRDLIPVMVRERLSPPPEETYSLHRKLSGAFLLCARLGSRVKCRELFQTALEKADLDAASD